MIAVRALLRRVGVVSAGVSVALVVQASPALAYTAFYPTQSLGNRGVDVTAIQLLLGVTADGVFGSGTESAVRAFQSNHGLTADGIPTRPTTADEFHNTVTKLPAAVAPWDA